KHDKICWQLVLALLRAELAKEQPGGKNEEKVAGDVVESCLNAFRRISHKETLAEMTKLAKAKAENPRLRAYAVWGLSDRSDPKDLAELFEDKSPLLQIAVMDMLAERADASTTPLFLKVLSENRTWEVKWLAL